MRESILSGLLGASYAAAVSGGFQVVSVVAGSGLEAVHVWVVACVGLLITTAAAAISGAGLGIVMRRAERKRRDAAIAGLALGWASGISVLALLDHGALPRLAPGAIGGPGAAAIAVMAGAAAGLTRRVLLKSGKAWPSVLKDGPVVAVVLVGLPLAAARLGRSPTSAKGLALWAAAAVCVLSAVWAFGKMRRVPGERGLRFGATVLTVAILLSSGILALANSRTPELPRRSEGPPDVLIVVLDTTRADFVPAPADSPYGTPNLERLTLEGVLFERAFSTSCWTLPAHASLFTGLAPTEHGASWRTERLPPGPPTLAETFAAAGWRTGAFSANPWVSREFGFGRGFAVFAEADADRRPRPPWQARLLPGLFDRLDASLVYEDKGGFSLTANLLRFLERDGTRPVFAFLNLMEPHLPYRPPRRVLGELEGTGWTHESLASVNQDPLHDLTPGAVRTRREIEALRRLYAAEIAYADSLLGRILDALERSGRLDRTLIVVTSDHGENLGDHPPLDHQLGLWDTLVHVPLVLRYPDWRAGGVRIDDLVSLADVPKAVLHLAGIEAGGGPVLGATKRDAIFVEYDRPVWILERIRSRLGLDPTPWDRDLQGLRTADRKWIESSDGRHHAYELRSDPGERRNLVGAAGNAPPEFAELALHLTETRNTLSEQFQEETESVLSEEARRKLRALGYLH